MAIIRFGKFDMTGTIKLSSEGESIRCLSAIDECLKAGNSIIISRDNVELVLPSVISELLRFTVAGIVDGAEVHVKRFDSQEPTHILSRSLAGGRYVLGKDDLSSIAEFERLYRALGVLRMLNGFDRPVVRTDNEQGGSYYLSAVLIQLIEFVVANVGCDYSISISD